MSASLLMAVLEMCLRADAPIATMKQSTVRIHLAVIDPVRKKAGVIGSGSGFFAGPKQIVTNWHVCCKPLARELSGLQKALIVSTDKDHQYQAQVLWSNQQKDLAVLELESNPGKPVVTFAASKTLRETMPVWAIGYPGEADRAGDEDSVFIPTISGGKISRLFNGNFNSSAATVRLVQHEAATNPGNSGGPLFDDCGRVIAINRAKSLTSVVTADGKTERLPVGENINWSVEAEELLSELAKLKLQAAVADGVCQAGISQSQTTAPWMIGTQVGTLFAALTAIGLAMNRKVRTAVTQKLRASPKTMRRGTLRGVAGPYAGSAIDVSKPCTFGRDPQLANLVFPVESSQISKKHCLLRFDGSAGRFYLEDTWSSNGTFLSSGQRIPAGASVELKPGDRFYLGTPENMFEVRLDS